ncbi:hypothetical protein C1H46_040161 [Malus baccata]|uniref:Uncharacterized protein n=1 Tax=Malus baccata TaxID=106549 RepID=A0A540KJD4_MALBA|nr:hypothetical protein C1H46_040161 [Malus baccata]
MSNFMAASNQNQNPNKSFEVTRLPNDSISSLSFSPKSNILVVTSWDNQHVFKEANFVADAATTMGFKVANFYIWDGTLPPVARKALLFDCIGVMLGDTPEWTKLLVCPRHPYPTTNR